MRPALQQMNCNQPNNQNPNPVSSLPSALDPNRLVRLREVLNLIPVSRSTWLAWVASGKAPDPIHLGRCTCWRYSDLLNLIEKGELQK